MKKRIRLANSFYAIMMAISYIVIFSFEILEIDLSDYIRCENEMALIWLGLMGLLIMVLIIIIPFKKFKKKNTVEKNEES